jgi:hypothetical protein
MKASRPGYEENSEALRTEIALNLEVPIRLTWAPFDRIAQPGAP